MPEPGIHRARRLHDLLCHESDNWIVLYCLVIGSHPAAEVQYPRLPIIMRPSLQAAGHLAMIVSSSADTLTHSTAEYSPLTLQLSRETHQVRRPEDHVHA